MKIFSAVVKKFYLKEFSKLGVTLSILLTKDLKLSLTWTKLRDIIFLPT